MKKITMPKQNAKNEAASANRKRLLNNDSPFSIKESYVKLRTSLMFCMTADSKRACRTFAITSSNPSDGKSLTAANVAISFAMLGKKTLLIDADMRKPNQRRLWRINPTTELCDFLAKIQDLSIYDVEGIPLSIVCTGTIPPNPSELLSSEGMKNFDEECSKLYEYIIIDTPPINTVADAQIVSTFVDGVVLIAKAENISLPSDKLNIVTVARFGKEKGVLRAIRAVSKLEKKDLLKYYIIGDGTEFEQAKALIDELKLSENVTLLGEKENPYGYIKAADLLLIPSYSEAAPMVIGEAACLGVPVLSTETSSCEEMVVATGYGFVCKNSQGGITQALEEIINNQSLIKEKSSFLDSQKFSNANALKQFSELVK